MRKALTPRQRYKVFERDNFMCAYCGVSADAMTLQIDHITPVSKGGTNDINNLVTACKECNQGKYTYTLRKHRPRRIYSMMPPQEHKPFRTTFHLPANSPALQFVTHAQQAEQAHDYLMAANYWLNAYLTSPSGTYTAAYKMRLGLNLANHMIHQRKFTSNA